MPDFHETRMGQEFFMKSFPKLVKDIERIANSLENKNGVSVTSNETLYCQKIKEADFAELLADVTDSDVSVGYFHKSIPSFRSIVMNRELAFPEMEFVLQKIVEKFIDKKVKNIENINARCGYVYIAFSIENV